MNSRNISEYYEKEVPAYGCYDNIRKISGIDGLKNSQRKIIWAAFKRCFNDYIKTDTMCAQCQIDTCYIHGAANLESVIAGLVQGFVGANNYPLLIGNSGGFGCRLNTRAAAGRYTRVKLAPIAKVLLKGVDNDILEKQYFEGQYIEPRCLMPIFPILFLNGSNGLSIGFSQNIYPRNPEKVIEYIKKKIAGTAHPRIELLPWFKGFSGTISKNSETGTVESFGVITRNNTTSYTITELPIGMEYQKYVEVLDGLCDNGTIQDYVDKCDAKLNDRILFEVKTTRDFTKRHEDLQSLLRCFKLVKPLTETLTQIDELGRVQEFNSIYEMLDIFIKIRLEFYKKRKDYLLKTLKLDIEKLTSKYIFIKGIVDGTIVVNKKSKAEIVKQLEHNPKITKIDGSYEYLLAMPIHSLTKEKMEELKALVQDKKAEHDAVKQKTIEAMWTDDLQELKKQL